VFAHSQLATEVVVPILVDEARAVHEWFWS
jgi:hypothetical protein